jgi:transposase-like protein
MANPFRYFNSSPEVIRAAVLLYIKYPLSLRNVEDLLAKRGIDVCHETVRQWWNLRSDVRRRDQEETDRGSARDTGMAMAS